MKRSVLFLILAISILALPSCETKINQANVVTAAAIANFQTPVPTLQAEGDELVGVYLMPSWNTSADPAIDRDSFWSCITGRGDCSNLQNPGIWGPRGIIYNARYPYEAPI